MLTIVVLPHNARPMRNAPPSCRMTPSSEGSTSEGKYEVEPKAASKQRLIWTTGGVLVGMWLAVGCAASDVDIADDDEGQGAAGGGEGGQGGTAEGGGGNDPGPCGTDCSAIAAPQCFVGVCNTGQHPGPVGSCVVVPSDANVPCDDGLFCTVNDVCNGEGVCEGGGENDCGMRPGDCEAIVCDETSDACTTQNLPAGAACTPDDLCVVGGTCDAFGTCTGTPKDCFFAPVPNECHIAECNPSNGICEPVPGNTGDPCVDQNDLCTVGKTCDNAGNCGGGAPKDCSNLTSGCDLGICDTTNGQCTTMSVADGQLCDDLNGCTVGEICSSGTCGGGTLVTTCSGAQTADGCCPSGCTEGNDLDCAICVANWDDATLQGWIVSSTCSPQINWQPDNTRAAGGTHSLYYGDPVTQNYNCTGGAHSGTATSKFINLHPGAPDVTFSVFIHTEGGLSYDQLGLWVMPANVKVWDRNDFTQGASGNTNGQFVQQTVDLSAYANQTIQLQFRFNTVDSISNSTEGVYIDSLTVQGSCP